MLYKNLQVAQGKVAPPNPSVDNSPRQFTKIPETKGGSNQEHECGRYWYKDK